MGLFSRFFELENKLPDPEIQFGRFSDTYKDEAKYKSWQKAVDLFDNEKFLDSYEYLLDFQKDDQFAVKHGIRKLSMSLQFDPKASREEILRQKAVLDQNGLTAYSFGVAATPLNKDDNRKLFDAGIAGIPGLASMPLEATYLAWVDFAGTGMTQAEFIERVQKGARIATNHGSAFGTGGESFLRFNLATPRATVARAVERLQKAFADLQ